MTTKFILLILMLSSTLHQILSAPVVHTDANLDHWYKVMESHLRNMSNLEKSSISHFKYALYLVSDPQIKNLVSNIQLNGLPLNSQDYEWDPQLPNVNEKFRQISGMYHLFIFWTARWRALSVFETMKEISMSDKHAEYVPSLLEGLLKLTDVMQNRLEKAAKYNRSPESFTNIHICSSSTEGDTLRSFKVDLLEFVLNRHIKQLGSKPRREATMAIITSPEQFAEFIMINTPPTASSHPLTDSVAKDYLEYIALKNSYITTILQNHKMTVDYLLKTPLLEECAIQLAPTAAPEWLSRLNKFNNHLIESLQKLEVERKNVEALRKNKASDDDFLANPSTKNENELQKGIQAFFQNRKKELVMVNPVNFKESYASDLVYPDRSALDKGGSWSDADGFIGGIDEKQSFEGFRNNDNLGIENKRRSSGDQDAETKFKRIRNI